METETLWLNERSLNLALVRTISVKYRQIILKLRLRLTVSLIRLWQILWVGGRRLSKPTRTLSKSNIKTVSIANTQGGKVPWQRDHHEVIVPYASAKRTQPASPLSLEVIMFRILRMIFLNNDQWYRNLLQHTQSLSSSTSQLSKEPSYLDITHHSLQRQRDHHHM